MSYLTKIVNWCIQVPMLHPGFGRALLAQTPESAAGATLEILRVGRTQLLEPGETRERILETSLALFNRFGEPHITTADIADEMNISPGNLYYHFRNKDEIIGELFAAYEARVLPLLAVPEGRAVNVEDLWLLLHLLQEEMWAARFLYRDLDELASPEEIDESLRALAARRDAWQALRRTSRS